MAYFHLKSMINEMTLILIYTIFHLWMVMFLAPLLMMYIFHGRVFAKTCSDVTDFNKRNYSLAANEVTKNRVLYIINFINCFFFNLSHIFRVYCLLQ